MSQTASNNLLIPEPSEELIVSEPWTMETYADDLMNELFSDIDGILDGSSNLSSQIVQTQQQLVLNKTKLPQIVPPPTIVSNISEVEQRRITAHFHSVGSNVPKTTRRVKKTRRKLGYTLRQIIKLGAGLGLAIAGINWAINSGFLNRLTDNTLQFVLQQPALEEKALQPENSAPTQAEIKSDLVEYMLGALAIIDRRKESQNRTSVNNIARINPVATKGATTISAKQSTANVAKPSIAKNTKPSATHTSRIVERIYIPVYQAPQPMRYSPPPVAEAPLPPVKTADKQIAPKPSDNKPKKAAPVKAAKAKPAEKNTALASIQEIKPVEVKTKPVNIKEVPKLPKIKEPATVAAPSPAASPAPVEQKQQKVASIPTSSHVLEGLLELGEQSAALFKVNGVTRRIQKGESIGASGWKLVDVANGEAIIRRNGEVRSIFAGQKF